MRKSEEQTKTVVYKLIFLTIYSLKCIVWMSSDYNVFHLCFAKREWNIIFHKVLFNGHQKQPGVYPVEVVKGDGSPKSELKRDHRWYYVKKRSVWNSKTTIAVKHGELAEPNRFKQNPWQRRQHTKIRLATIFVGGYSKDRRLRVPHFKSHPNVGYPFTLWQSYMPDV